MKRTLIVSIHDVSPLTRETTAALLSDLASLGVERTSLLVIPDHHRRAPINADAGFGQWLRDEVARGHEPVLHGYFHERATRLRESLLTRTITRIYTAGEGEFFDIEPEAARLLLSRGRDEVARCAGVTPTGFIAPAWLLGAGGETAARELGFAYTTRLGTVESLQLPGLWKSQSLCWSVRHEWRRRMSLAWNARLFERLRANPLLRITIHPPDFTYPAIWSQIRSLVSGALEDRAAITYCEWVSSFPIPSLS